MSDKEPREPRTIDEWVLVMSVEAELAGYTPEERLRLLNEARTRLWWLKRRRLKLARRLRKRRPEA